MLPADRFYDAFDPRLRDPCLPDLPLGQGAATKPKTVRVDCGNGAIRVTALAEAYQP